MRTLKELNPVTVFLYFALVTGAGMFIAYPPVLAVSLAGAVSYRAVLCAGKDNTGGHFHLFVWLLFVVLSLANPLVSHKGETVLVIINNRRITLESLLYGINSSLMIVAMLYWFSCLTLIMTGDKLIYLTGLLSKRLSLVISMSVRFVPLFSRQTKKVRDAQTAMGLYNEDSIMDDIRSSVRVFSIIVTWALENGITTADSMEARGFSLGRRSCFRIVRFTLYDAAVCIASAGLFSAVLVSRLCGGMDYTFYPRTEVGFNGALAAVGLAGYALLAFLPSIIEAEVGLKWKLLRSKI